MIKALILVVMMQPAGPVCVNAAPLSAGSPAPCSGLLISRAQAERALKCERVKIPKLEAEITYERRACRARVDGLDAQIAALDLALDAEIEKDPWWRLPLVAVGFAAVGYAVGALAVRP